MSLKCCRFVAVMLASLSTGMSFCHVLEMPARRGWNADLWVGTTVHGHLYRMFGPDGVGPWIDAGAILAAAVLVKLAWTRRPSAWWTLAGALGLAIAHAAWWAIVYPANLELANWATNPVPPDWTRWRDRWEFGHAAATAFKLAGLSALVLSLVVDAVPDRAASASSPNPETTTR